MTLHEIRQALIGKAVMLRHACFCGSFFPVKDIRPLPQVRGIHTLFDARNHPQVHMRKIRLEELARKGVTSSDDGKYIVTIWGKDPGNIFPFVGTGHGQKRDICSWPDYPNEKQDYQ